MIEQASRAIDDAVAIVRSCLDEFEAAVAERRAMIADGEPFSPIAHTARVELDRAMADVLHQLGVFDQVCRLARNDGKGEAA